MNRREFMDALERLLSDVPLDDKIDALQYYEDYFEDAGYDKEQDIINELKSPENVAKIIKKDLGITTDNYTENAKSEYKDYRSNYSSQKDGYTQYNNSDNNGYTQFNTSGNVNTGESYSYNNNEKKTSKIDRRLLIVILICTLPITAGPIMGFFGALFGIVVGVFGFTFGMYAGGIGCIIGAIALITTGTLSEAALVLGIGFILLAIALFATLLCSLLCRVVIPAIFQGIRRLFQYFFRDGEATA